MHTPSKAVQLLCSEWTVATGNSPGEGRYADHEPQSGLLIKPHISVGPMVSCFKTNFGADYIIRQPSEEPAYA